MLWVAMRGVVTKGREEAAHHAAGDRVEVGGG
jgi:hypothetical protein